MIDLGELNFSGRRRLPVVRGVEAAECGLACMTMISCYHGHDVDLNGLRQRFPVSMAGATLRNLMQLAGQIGFTSRALRVELDDLPQLQTPAILHWDLDHFVVLKEVRLNRAVIHDPAQGVRTLTVAELSRHFTGVALEVEPAAAFTPVKARLPVGLTDLWGKMTGLWPALLQVFGLSLALQIVTFAAPFQMQLVIDEGVMRGDTDILLVIALAFMGLLVIQTAIEALRNWLLQVFGQLLSFQMVGNVVHHLMRLPTEWFEKRAVGDILSRVGSATAIQDILTRGVMGALIDGMMAIAAIVILIVYSPTLAAVVVMGVAINIGVALALFPAMRARSEQEIIARAREQTQIMETVRAAGTIKIMGREVEREGAWRNLFANTVNTSVAVGKVQIGLSATQMFVTGMQTIVVLYLGARMITAAEGFSLGMLIAFLSFRQTFSDRSVALINQAIQFNFISLHLERLADIVTAAPDTATNGGFMLNKVGGSIALQNISFSYGAGERAIFENLNMDIRPGEYVAITGPSGGGKTTLLKILLGTRNPTEGRIELDGDVAAPERWRAWREHVGLVAQDDRLLSGSIADNISFFDPDLDMERVREAAVAARIHEEISLMPMHYLSLVGDMGSTLSGGQKQRILLARALYRRPSILILDEGTANLDVETESILAERISAMSITRIVVAHRPALLHRADRVLELRGGTLKEIQLRKGID